MVRFHNKRGTTEQWIKQGKQAVKMTRRRVERRRGPAAYVEAVRCILMAIRGPRMVIPDGRTGTHDRSFWVAKAVR